MTQAIEKYDKGDPDAHLEFIENARGYTELLRQHIYKEDNILYPMADSVFQEKTQKELLKEFDRVETDEIGEGVHEKYHEILHRLIEIYL